MDTPRPYGDYVLLERLGVGGMSEVDLARKRVPGSPAGLLVVIKRIKTGKTEDDSFLRMFKDEARITSELHHPNIARFVDFGQIEDEFYLALEYVPGVDLGQVLRVLRDRNERIPLRIALRVMCDVLAGLDHAHQARDRFGQPMQIVHRDVSPRNVMLAVSGQIKLIDFGVARATNRLEQTTANLVKGKFNYMAPEQIAGERVDHRADVFAAGLLLHEMLTGLPPFHGMTRSAIAHHLLTDRLPSPPTTPDVLGAPGLMDVYHLALKADRALRYPTAGAFREGLLRVGAALGGLPDDRAMAAFVALAYPDAGRRVHARARAEAQRTGTPMGARVRAYPSLAPAQSRTLAWGFLAFSAAVGALLSTIAVGVLVWALAPRPALDPDPPGAVTEVAPEAPTVPPEPTEPAEPAERAVTAPEPAREAPRPAPAAPAPATPAPATPAPATPAPPVAPTVVRIAAPAPPPAPAPPAPTVVRVAVPAPTVTVAPAPRPEPEVEPVVMPVVLPVVEAVVEPVVKPVASAGSGFLRVSSTPTGASIRVDGRDTGHTTPAEFAWPAGTVEVEVVGIGKRTVAVTKDQLSVVSVR